MSGVWKEIKKSMKEHLGRQIMGRTFSVLSIHELSLEEETEEEEEEEEVERCRRSKKPELHVVRKRTKRRSSKSKHLEELSHQPPNQRGS